MLRTVNCDVARSVLACAYSVAGDDELDERTVELPFWITSTQQPS
jgi:hypothetical protein